MHEHKRREMEGEGQGGFTTHLVRHEVGQEHDVAAVDAHSVVHHGVLYLVDDGGASGLDAQRLLHLVKHGNSHRENTIRAECRISVSSEPTESSRCLALTAESVLHRRVRN